MRVNVAERCVQQTVEKPRLCKCVVFEEQLHAVASALAASGALDEGGPRGGGGRGGRGGKPGAGEASSLDEVTRELERFMLADDEGADKGDPSSCRTS